ncbi:hypothetical protein JVX93_15735 [Mycolicibacterium boenickei]|nr:hypothetical protein JVX93_15735 [Mycolicibacterium boenickei]
MSVYGITCTDVESFGGSGRASTVLYLRDDARVYAWTERYSDEINVNIGGLTGSHTLSFSPDQWRKIIAHVTELMPTTAVSR